jgi:hypothetical protein
LEARFDRDSRPQRPLRLHLAPRQVPPPHAGEEPSRTALPSRDFRGRRELLEKFAKNSFGL